MNIQPPPTWLKWYVLCISLTALIMAGIIFSGSRSAGLLFLTAFLAITYFLSLAAFIRTIIKK